MTLPDPAIIQETKSKVELFLYSNCLCLAERKEFVILFLSRSEDKITQRQLNFTFDGNFSLKVHCKPFSTEALAKKVPPSSEPLSLSTIPAFVDRMVQVINAVRELEICTGVDTSDFKTVWPLCSSGVIDLNPYKETRYVETIRRGVHHSEI